MGVCAVNERCYYVYAVVAGCNVLYIGKGKGKRAWHHLSNQCKNPKLKVAIACARENGTAVKVRMLKTGLSEAEAYNLERRWIVRFNKRLTNATLGQMSEAERVWYEAIADAKRYRFFTEAEIMRQGAVNGLSVEQRLKWSRFISVELKSLFCKIRAEIPGPVPPLMIKANELIIIQ